MTGLSKVSCAPKWSMQSKAGAQQNKHEVPGPGTYVDTDLVAATAYFKQPPKFSFGSATRVEIDRSCGPGPGAYGHGHALGKQGPAASCTPRRAQSSARGVKPGPGDHNL